MVPKIMEDASRANTWKQQGHGVSNLKFKFPQGKSKVSSLLRDPEISDAPRVSRAVDLLSSVHDFCHILLHASAQAMNMRVSICGSVQYRCVMQIGRRKPTSRQHGIVEARRVGTGMMDACRSAKKPH